MNRRITLMDIAQAVGVSQSTVSRALNNDARIRLSLRKKIHEMAEAMHFRPDPSLSALAYYRKKQKSNEARTALAFLYIGTLAQIDRAKKYNQILIDIPAAAERHGYRIELFFLRIDLAEEHRRMKRILKARGIRGVLVFCHEHEIAQIDLAWEDYCVVSVSGRTEIAGITSVTTNYHSQTRLCVSKLAHLGYQRIGYAAFHYSIAVLDAVSLGSYLSSTQIHPTLELVPPFLVPPGKNLTSLIGSFRDWVECNRIEAVIVSSEQFLDSQHRIMLGERSLEFCVDGLQSLKIPVAGAHCSTQRIADICVQVLHHKLSTNQFERQVKPLSVQLCPEWHDGPSLKRIKP